MSPSTKEICERIGFAVIATLLSSGAIILAVLVLAGTSEAANADTPPPVLTISAVVDTATRDKLGEQVTRDWVAVTMSDTAEVYRSQLDLDVRMTRLDFNHIADDTQPSFLLDKIVKLRNNDSQLYETGVTIFFTDRSLKIGSQLYDGYADAGPPCSSLAVAVVHFDGGDLTTAHELGHVFGAPHDGEEQCASTPKSGYIMQSVGDNGTRFSQCSIDIIKQTIASAACLHPLCSPCTPPPVQNSGGGGSFDDTFIGFLFGFALGLYASRRRR